MFLRQKGARPTTNRKAIVKHKFINLQFQTMLYNLFWLLFRVTFRFFFRETAVQNRERIPATGPLLICANHPGALLDPLVIAVLLGRRVHFLAKAVAFKTKFAQWLLPKFNMIPIYRKQDDPTQLHRNEETFARCYEQLAKGAAILIFPEGISITERKLRELKTGAARIALGAEEANNFSLNVKILAVGLNYDDPHTFRRDVFIKVAEPIAVSDYRQQFGSDGFAAAEALTEEIRRRLEAQIIHIENEEDERLVLQTERLRGEELRKSLGLPHDSAEHEFQLTRRIAAVAKWFRENDPELLAAIRSEMSSYFWKIDELGLSDSTLRGKRSARSVFDRIAALLRTVLGFPFYLCGLLLNVLPFRLASVLSKTLVKAREFRGAIGAVTGALLFLVWYVLLGGAVHYFSGNGWIALGVVLAALPLGLFAWYYHRTLLTMARRWLLSSLFLRRRTLVAQLITQRAQLNKRLEEAEKIYRAKTGH
jgi:glycerol-3-phosphate O-acyltransferase / dihydroxyacetone phosphate acyltransferase